MPMVPKTTKTKMKSAVTFPSFGITSSMLSMINFKPGMIFMARSARNARSARSEFMFGSATFASRIGAHAQLTTIKSRTHQGSCM